MQRRRQHVCDLAPTKEVTVPPDKNRSSEPSPRHSLAVFLRLPAGLLPENSALRSFQTGSKERGARPSRSHPSASRRRNPTAISFALESIRSAQRQSFGLFAPFIGSNRCPHEKAADDLRPTGPREETRAGRLGLKRNPPGAWSPIPLPLSGLWLATRGVGGGVLNAVHALLSQGSSRFVGKTSLTRCKA